jgi:hypothetical protein
VLEQGADLVLGPAVFGCCRLWEPSEQGRNGSYVLASPGEVQETIIILNDPLVHFVGTGARTPTVSATFDLALELRVLLL